MGSIYRLVPYMIVPRSVDREYNFDNLIKNKLDEEFIYIQDSDDMIVEKYTLSQLQEIQRDYGVAFEGFTLYPEVATSYSEVLSDWYNYRSFEYLGGILSICRDTDDTNYRDNIERYGCKDPMEAIDFMDGVRLTYGDRVFKLNVSSDYGLTHSLFINDMYVCTFKIAKSLEAFYFVQLVQVGGNFVLTLYSVCFADESYNRNIVITLDTNLDPLMLWNLTDIVGASTVSEYFKNIIR